MAVPTGVGLLAQLDLSSLGDGVDKLLTIAGGHLTSYLFVFIIIAALYCLVPYERPSWREVLPGSLLAAFLLELGKAGFLFYLENVAHLKTVYGSVTSFIVLLLWLYYSGRVLLFGAELIAVVRERAVTTPTTA